MRSFLYEADWFGYCPLVWIFIFFIYSAFGWIWECLYMSVLEKHLTNRGFLYGPWIPLYGTSGTLLMMFIQPFREWWWAVAIVGMIFCTCAEEITGRLMDRFFDVQYWTYEGYPGNIDNFICIPASLLWGVFTLIAAYPCWKPLVSLTEYLGLREITDIVFFMVVLFVIDVTISIKNAVDFKNVIASLVSIKDRAAELRERVSAMSEEYYSRHPVQSAIKDKLEPDLNHIPGSIRKIREKIRELRLRYSEDPEKSSADMSEIDRLEDDLSDMEAEARHMGRHFRVYLEHLRLTSPGAYVRKLGYPVKKLASVTAEFVRNRRDRQE